MTLEEKLQIENNRNADNLSSIYLFRDGDNSSWYKAYEWSAYLCEFFNKNLDEKSRLNAISKKYNGIDEPVINIGLQMSSFAKYFPGVAIDNINSNIINVSYKENSEFNIENYKDSFSKWKNSFEVKDSKKKTSRVTNKMDNVYNHPYNFLYIMKEILKYDTDDKSPEELKIFIKHLRGICCDFIC